MNEGIAQSLKRDHQVIQTVLPQIRMQVNALGMDSTHSQIEFLRRAISYMNTYPSAIHHPAEELIFERLSHYSPDMLPLCEELIAQHQLFKSVEMSILSDIDLLITGDTSAIERIKHNGIRYCDVHIGHVDSEDESVLPAALGRFTEDDWLELRKKVHLEIDPLSNPAVFEQYGSVYDFIMAFDANARLH